MAKKRSKLKSNKTPPETKQHVVEPKNGVSDGPVTFCKTVPPKVCRLCETKDGPFLNIFGGEKNTAKKIDELMPFEVAENDELPHNVCFRCSAKVEELHEFVQKCIKTQNNLGNAMGIPFCLVLKSKRDRSLWEQKLNRSNITNDDICDAVVKKAIEEMQGSQKQAPVRKGVTAAKPNTKTSSHTTATVNATINEEKSCNKTSLNGTTSGDTSNRTSVTATVEKKSFLKPKAKPVSTKTVTSEPESFLALASDDSNIPIVEIRTEIIEDEETENSLGPQKTDKIPFTRSLRSSNSDTVHQVSELVVNNKNVAKGKNNNNSTLPDKEKSKINMSENTMKKNVEAEKTVTPKPFNIMDHISIIKVNGVGVLFQCSMCKRNFLKKDVVMSHWCAKKGVPKEDFTKIPPPPDPPKVPNIKYINTTSDGSIKKQILDSKVINEKNCQKLEDQKSVEVNRSCLENRPKPKMGPASKVKRPPDNALPAVGMLVTPKVPSPPPTKNHLVNSPVQVSGTLGANCHYKLVSGPNNTFTLVEKEKTSKQYSPQKRKLNADKIITIGSNANEQVAQKEITIRQYASKKRKLNNDNEMSIESKDNVPQTSRHTSERPVVSTKDAQQPSVSQPYPVGLIKNVPRHGTDTAVTLPTPFTTSAQKKQSYTIVQTGHPNKLLISAKPQPPAQQPEKIELKKISGQQVREPVQPFSITLVENQPKDIGDFFTFINVDPLLQPSYVLPTDTLLQESQISRTLSQNTQNSCGSSNTVSYTCNMCNETFSREKKLLAHIQSHYNRMDEEDNYRSDKPNRNRRKKK
ncbi:uncharacterized protein LOC126380447 [Pectinophora gossypiella]|uniref:uncharacterized protein LOC126380447 n=1 Tax=Pectinophora gossypiella TaxID=13191 RepID=UPI00214F2DC3|nr:uncharacterized protein LOC126380447 [Pectinophora gossypiella]